MADPRQHDQSQQIHHERAAQSVTPTNFKVNISNSHPNHPVVASTVPPSILATNAGADHLPLDCDSDSYYRQGVSNRTYSPPSRHSLSRVRSGQQQQQQLSGLPLADSLGDASTQPAYLPRILSWTDWDESSSSSSVTDLTSKNDSDVALSRQGLPIPTRRKDPNDSSTQIPLSGRPPRSFLLDRAFRARFRPPSPSLNLHTHHPIPTGGHSLDRPPFSMSSRPSQSSPLSPTIPAQPMMIPRRHKQASAGHQPQSRPDRRPRPAAQQLSLTGLPKYHPANFPTSGDNTPLSPRSIQALNAPKRNLRPGSDAQHALQKYQREVVSRASGLSELAKPTSPRLIPEGSPAGSMTPLALEAQSDYLLSALNLPANTADARKIVDQILQKENEQRMHSEPGRSPSHSPAVTPPV